MTPLVKILILIFIGTILEVSLLPLISVAGATVSLIALSLSCVALLGFLDLAFTIAILGGILLDLLSPPPFGIRTAILVTIWTVIAISYRYRLIAPRTVIVGAAMAIVGTLISLPYFLATYDWIATVSSVSLHMIAGIVLFPAFIRLFPREEIVKL